MSKFSIDYSQRLPSGQSAARMITGDTAAPYRALAKLGQSITGITDEIQAQKDALDYSKGQRQVDERINAAYEELTGDEDSDKEVWDTVQKDVSGIQYKSKKVNNQLTMYVNRIAPGVQQTLMDRHQGIVKQNIHDQFEAEGQTMLAKGDLDGYQDILDRRLVTKDISQAEYQALSKSAMSDSILEQSRDLISTGVPENNLTAMEMLSTVPTMEGVSTEKKEYAQTLISIAKKQGNALSEEANKSLTDLFSSGSLDVTSVQKLRSQLSDTDYQTWTKIAVSPVDKRGNIIKTTELKSLSIDVWRGSLSRMEVESKIRESLADPKGINEKQYAAIYADLNREVKGYQAQDTKKYSIEATRMILGKDAGVITLDSLGNLSIDVNKMLSPQADFEKKMGFVNLYNKEMSDYLADNPKSSKKEMYVKSQELKSTYVSAAKGETVAGGLSAEKEARRQELLRKAGK